MLHTHSQLSVSVCIKNAPLQARRGSRISTWRGVNRGPKGRVMRAEVQGLKGQVMRQEEWARFLGRGQPPNGFIIYFVA